MRHVVSSQEVFHLWAHQTQDNARSHGSVSFYGPSAYSYAAELGRIVTHADGRRAYLVNTHSYSNTTSKHQSYLRHAIPHGSIVFTLPTFAGTRQDQFNELVSEIGELQGKAERARANKVHLLRQVQERIEHANQFAEFFGLTDRIGSTANAQEFLAAAEARYAEERRQRAERERAAEEARVREAMEQLPEWLRGERLHTGRLPHQYMRLRTEEDGSENIETTLGATVPAEHVRKALPFVLKRLCQVSPDSGGWTPAESGREIRLGHYKLSGISAEGVVTVGCHQFEASEIRRIAGILLAK